MIAGNIVCIRERVRLFKFADVYDLLDPDSGMALGEARERVPMLVKLARLVLSKRMLPVEIEMTLAGAVSPSAVIAKPFTFWRARCEIRDGQGALIGMLEAPVLSLFKYFRMLSPDGREMGSLKGDFIGWNFTIESTTGGILGTITKKWAGLTRELLTSADRYQVAVQGAAQGDRALKTMVIASAIALDAVFKESGSRTAIGELSD